MKSLTPTDVQSEIILGICSQGLLERLAAIGADYPEAVQIGARMMQCGLLIMRDQAKTRTSRRVMKERLRAFDMTKKELLPAAPGRD